MDIAVDVARCVHMIASFLACIGSMGCVPPSGAGPSFTRVRIPPGVFAKVIHPDLPAGAGIVNRPEVAYAECLFHWDGPGGGQVKVSITNLRLEVNGQDLGPVLLGDDIVVDATGVGLHVFVNGVERVWRAQDEAGEVSG